MDAPDDNRDIKLYRASADLLPDITRQLDGLLTDISNAEKFGSQQLWVADSHIQNFILLVSNFPDESPGLCLSITISSILFKNGLS